MKHLMFWGYGEYNSKSMEQFDLLGFERSMQSVQKNLLSYDYLNLAWSNFFFKYLSNFFF